jgi:hypothetical protein
MSGTGVPVVFIHGPWLQSTSWQPWADRGPLLIISGGKDRTVPDSVSRAAYKLYGRSAAVRVPPVPGPRSHADGRLGLDRGRADGPGLAGDEGISGHTALP